MRLPGWFRVLFTVVMLALCAVTVWHTLSGYTLLADRTDLLTKLDTSQGRERRQQAELDKANASLPQVQAELDTVQPMADEAKVTETALRDDRKRLRREVSELQAALDELTAVNDELQTLIETTETVRRRIAQTNAD